MTTVTWIQDVNGNYEVSSPEHLRQIMHEGSLYTDAGSPPSSYWAADYKQTADIDLLGDSTDIKPIGSAQSQYQGVYDGGSFKISNWSYIDPKFNSTENCVDHAGLFGMSVNILKNIRLDGLWTIQGFTSYTGFLVGYLLNEDANSGAGIFNVECDFADGSLIDTNKNLPTAVGGVVGEVRSSMVAGITLKGSIDLHPAASTFAVGGVIGRSVSTTLKLLQNLATFPSGISAGNSSLTRSVAGGVLGACTFNSAGSLSTFINAMTGDINGLTGSGMAGGVIGEYYDPNLFASIDTMVNAMTGNITSSRLAGGVVAACSPAASSSRFVNYMSGNISSDDNSLVGGLVGSFYLNNGEHTPSSSINAMNGNVYNPAAGGVVNLTATVRTDFGLTYSTNNYVPSSSPTGYSTTSEFTDLPYLPLSGSDSHGNSYDFNFVFANLAGNSSYDSYTHLVLHKGDIYTPFGVNFDVPADNTTLYATFVNATTQIYLQPLLSVYVYRQFSLQPRSVNIPVVIDEVAGATSYKLTFQSDSGVEVVSVSGVSTLEHNITGVEPDTLYTIRLYADNELVEELTTTTLPNVSTSYDVQDFVQDGVITLPEDSASNIAEVMNELFNTGDVINVSVNKRGLDASFVRLGDTLSIEEIRSGGLLLPFIPTSGTGQDVSLTITDGSTVDIDYDDNANSVTVGNSVYFPNDYFILDGKKVTVVEYY